MKIRYKIKEWDEEIRVGDWVTQLKGPFGGWKKENKFQCYKVIKIEPKIIIISAGASFHTYPKYLMNKVPPNQPDKYIYED